MNRWLLRVPLAAVLISAIAIGIAEAEQWIAKRVVGAVQTYQVLTFDSWQTIASRFGVDARTVAADNGLTNAQPLRLGQLLRIDNRHIVPDAAARVSLVVNIPQRMLFFSDRTGISAYPIAAGGQRGVRHSERSRS
jgi:hypothetical protein